VRNIDCLPFTPSGRLLRSFKRLQRVRKSIIPDDYEIYTSEEIHMKSDPTSYKEVTRSHHSSKWLEAMKDKMSSMSANQV
jgi:hypothetical protein